MVLKELWIQYKGKMFTHGLMGAGLRDMGFTATYAAGGPFFKSLFLNNSYFQIVAGKVQIIPSDLIATICGGVVAGVIGAAATHPFDTWKTQRQAGMKTEFWPGGVRSIVSKSMGMEKGDQKLRLDRASISLFKNLIEEPYKGFGPRCTRVTSAVTLFNLYFTYAEAHLEKYKK